jgi:hypothetical protein
LPTRITSENLDQLINSAPVLMISCRFVICFATWQSLMAFLGLVPSEVTTHRVARLYYEDRQSSSTTGAD